MVINDELFEQQWKATVSKYEAIFGPDLDVDGILFLIGVQELGKGKRRFNKDQKLDVMHVAVCTLLEPMGYYTYLGTDKDGWPHWERVTKLPWLNPQEQERFIKEAIMEYTQSW